MKIKRIFLFVVVMLMFAGSSFANQKLKFGVYIWSSSFDDLKLSNIEKFVSSKGIDIVELSYKPFSENKDIKAWAKNLVLQGKDVEIVLSEPKYIFPERWGVVEDRLNNIFSSGFDVHLDIEPHILNGFKEDKAKYLKLFVEFLNKVHAVAEKYKKGVSVAITTRHYKGVIDDIARSSNRMVFMIYGVKNLKKIQETIEPYVRYNVAIAFRAEDFKSEAEFLSFMDKISLLTDVKIFIVQNLRQWDELPIR